LTQPITDLPGLLKRHGGLEYMGLAPFLRASIAGADLRTFTQPMLQQLDAHSGNANLLMNLSIAMQCLKQPTLGQEFQQEALSLARTYSLPTARQPAQLRLLVLVSPGSIQSNTPLDCLLEGSDIELVFHFVIPGADLLAGLPAHDLLFVGISDSDANRPLLLALAAQLQDWPKPVLNAPQHLPNTGRDMASSLLQGIPRLLAPATHRVSRNRLQALVAGLSSVGELFADAAFPFIVRPLGSQAGADLQRIGSVQELQAYLDALTEENFFIAPFVDYSDANGLFRKARVALIDGQPFVCHMAVSSHWMIHYVNAGMYEDASKRADEARFMAGFSDFVARHRQALDAISQRMQLDYLVMDCAETRTGELLLFEIDHGGVVHAMDVESIFPYKNQHIHKAQKAFTELLVARLEPS
jgi:hypothetical protein